MRGRTAYISGKVQKTGFRARVVSIARDFGLSGYVQNLDDGRVRVVAEGEYYDLESLLAAINIKNTLIQVADIQKEYSTATNDFQGFFKVVSGSGETDQRIDQAAELLKELISVNKDVLVEIKATRDDLKAEIVGVKDQVKSSGDLLAERIDSSREEISHGIYNIRTDLRDDLKDRLIKIEADVSQLKAKTGI